MEKKDILEYVSETPYNTNVNVLRTMLDQLTTTLDMIKTTISFQNDFDSSIIITGDQTVNNIAENLQEELLEDNKTMKRVYNNISPTTSFQIFIRPTVSSAVLSFEVDEKKKSITKRASTGTYSITIPADGKEHTVKIFSNTQSMV